MFYNFGIIAPKESIMTVKADAKTECKHKWEFVAWLVWATTPNPFVIDPANIGTGGHYEETQHMPEVAPRSFQAKCKTCGEAKRFMDISVCPKCFAPMQFRGHGMIGMDRVSFYSCSIEDDKHHVSGCT